MICTSSFSVSALFSVLFLFPTERQYGLLERPWAVDSTNQGLNQVLQVDYFSFQLFSPQDNDAIFTRLIVKSNETTPCKVYNKKKNVCVVNNNWVPLPVLGCPLRHQLWNSSFYFSIFPHITLILLLLEYVGFKGKTRHMDTNRNKDYSSVYSAARVKFNIFSTQ